MSGYAQVNAVHVEHGLDAVFGGGMGAGKLGLPQRRSAWQAPRARMQWMAKQLLNVQEDERKRLATDLHDGLGQSLSLIKFTLAETQALLASGAVDKASDSLQQLKSKVHGILDEVRNISMGMRPPMLDDLGLRATLSWFARELQATASARRIELDVDAREAMIPQPLKLTIFRIVQESCNNIVKHANAGLIRISLKEAEGAFRLVVEDDGDGFDQAEVALRAGSSRGLGMLSMKERAMLSGGSYRLESMPGQGTRIEVNWPFERLCGC